MRWAVDPSKFSFYVHIVSYKIWRQVPPSLSFFSQFCCTPIGNFCRLMFNQDYQILLPISSSSQGIFQTRIRMTLTIRRHFGILLSSHTTLFSSHSFEKPFPFTFQNQLLDTLALNAQVRLIVLENKPMHFSTSWFLALGDTFVCLLSFLLVCLTIS